MRPIIFLFLLIILLFSGCAEREEVVRVGVLIPETGSFATAGKAMKRAAELAAEHVKETNLDGEYKIELVFADCGSTPEEAKSAFVQLAAKGVKIIVGTYSSPQAIAAADAAMETKIPFIATVASTMQLEEKVAEGNRFVFRIAYNSTYWGELAREFLILANPENYCFVGYEPLKTFNSEMLRVIEKSGYEKICEIYYKSPKIAPESVKEVAREVAAKAGERTVVILGDPGPSSITFLKEYRASGGRGIVYSVGGTLAMVSLLENIKANYTAFQAAALEKTAKTEFTKKYFEDYARKYGEEANNYAGILTYDSILIVAQAVAKGGDIVEVLETGSFKGAAGIYTFVNHTANWGSENLKGVIAEFVGEVKVLYPPEYAESDVIWP